MQINQIKIKNFRLLQDFTIDLDKIMSLVIGKNNTGKTSLLSLLDRFLRGNQNNFTFHDFNIPFKELINICNFEEDLTPYSTQHGIKGC